MVFGLEHIAGEEEEAEEENAMLIFLSKQFSLRKKTMDKVMDENPLDIYSQSKAEEKNRNEMKIDHEVMFGSATGMLITAEINGALVSRRQTKTCKDEA